MMFGGNSKQLEQMMKQMGIDFEDVNAEEVVIRTEDGNELVFDGVEVNRMSGQGQVMYQVMGEPDTEREASESDTSQRTNEETTEETEQEESLGTQISEDDVELVALRANVSNEEARNALEENDGDLADAIASLSE